MSTDCFIIDGNNLIHRDADLSGIRHSDFVAARDALVHRLDGCASGIAKRIVIVFDGRASQMTGDPATSTVEVLFSPSNMTADSIIERMVYDMPKTETVTVVTSDRGERETVEAAGGHTMSCINFLELLCAWETDLAARTEALKTRASNSTLGDFFPDS